MFEILFVGKIVKRTVYQICECHVHKPNDTKIHLQDPGNRGGYEKEDWEHESNLRGFAENSTGNRCKRREVKGIEFPIGWREENDSYARKGKSDFTKSLKFRKEWSFYFDWECLKRYGSLFTTGFSGVGRRYNDNGSASLNAYSPNDIERKQIAGAKSD